MNAETDVDVAVVGAGPGGAVAAYAAARRGLRVALIDRESFPRDKTCGDGIGPGAVRVLRDLHLDSVLAGRRRIESVTVFGPAGERSENPVPVLAGKSTDVFVVPRVEFDEHLFRAAIAAGAEDVSGTRYLGMSGDAGGPARVLELRDAAGTHRRLRARLVIGADGAYSAVRKDLVGQDRTSRKFVGVAMRAYAASRDFEADGPSMLFEFSPQLLPSYGWIFPIGGGTVNIGVGLPIAQLRERGVDLRMLLGEFADRLRERGVEVGELRRERAHQLPGVIGMPRLAFERAALIGDAASMINPVSGEGIAYAMTAARRLVEALPADLADGAALDRALTRFEQGFRADRRLHFLSCRFTMALLRHGAPAAVVVRAIQNDPRVLGGVFDMLFGDGRLHAGTALRIARHAVAA
ncbi:geranylgeranyl reductase family protein [Actinospica durhamensis]|uniref:Geranylgeranyl reductase family protein n=1 Tax=Actinospica durhamensis TaxID=1508375 RepID=A0A941IS50_9ACTN|nr:geranylgeranyl reductase family protein [Actinospica durhamensis]MBR7832886.1 geranylgeranyl reductase family protein [Actinospica durhamensis]